MYCSSSQFFLLHLQGLLLTVLLLCVCHFSLHGHQLLPLAHFFASLPLLFSNLFSLPLSPLLPSPLHFSLLSTLLSAAKAFLGDDGEARARIPRGRGITI